MDRRGGAEGPRGARAIVQRAAYGQGGSYKETKPQRRAQGKAAVLGRRPRRTCEDRGRPVVARPGVPGGTGLSAPGRWAPHTLHAPRGSRLSSRKPRAQASSAVAPTKGFKKQDRKAPKRF